MDRQNGKCAICGAELTETLLTSRTPDRFEKAAGISEEKYMRCWMGCPVCQTASNIHRPENLSRLKNIATSYYQIDFRNSSIAEKYARIMGLPPEQSDNAQRVERIHSFVIAWFDRHFPNMGPPFRILDVGAGIGVFLACFLRVANRRQSRWIGVAVDSDPMACAHLRSLQLFDVIEETFPASIPGDFALCTLNKVVEHVAAPVEFVKQVASLLNAKHGILYVEVPDRLTISYRPPQDNILGALHYHLYTPLGIAWLLEGAGLATLQVMRFFEPSGKITTAAFAALPQAVAGIVRENTST